jgi:hypothetical protein
MIKCYLLKIPKLPNQSVYCYDICQKYLSTAENIVWQNQYLTRFDPFKLKHAMFPLMIKIPKQSYDVSETTYILYHYVEKNLYRCFEVINCNWLLRGNRIFNPTTQKWHRYIPETNFIIQHAPLYNIMFNHRFNSNHLIGSVVYRPADEEDYRLHFKWNCKETNIDVGQKVLQETPDIVNFFAPDTAYLWLLRTTTSNVFNNQSLTVTTPKETDIVLQNNSTPLTNITSFLQSSDPDNNPDLLTSITVGIETNKNATSDVVNTDPHYLDEFPKFYSSWYTADSISLGGEWINVIRDSDFNNDYSGSTDGFKRGKLAVTSRPYKTPCGTYVSTMFSYNGITDYSLLQQYMDFGIYDKFSLNPISQNGMVGYNLYQREQDNLNIGMATAQSVLNFAIAGTAIAVAVATGGSMTVPAVMGANALISGVGGIYSAGRTKEINQENAQDTTVTTGEYTEEFDNNFLNGYRNIAIFSQRPSNNGFNSLDYHFERFGVKVIPTPINFEIRDTEVDYSVEDWKTRYGRYTYLCGDFCLSQPDFIDDNKALKQMSATGITIVHFSEVI